MGTHRQILLAISFGTILSLKGFSQVGINLGVGPGGDENMNIAYNASINYLGHKTITSFRFANIWEFTFDSPAHAISDFSLLHGYRIPMKFGYVSLSSGLGMVRQVSQGELISDEGCWEWWSGCDYKRKTRWTVGIPLEMQLFLNYKIIGIGITPFANLNFLKSYFGVALSVQFGKLYL